MISLLLCIEDITNTCLQAQYGNLLRVEPAMGSPLLQPSNEHRTLVVIDFEYASPNARGYDIANHFVSSNIHICLR